MLLLVVSVVWDGIENPFFFFFFFARGCGSLAGLCLEVLRLGSIFGRKIGGA